MHDETFGQQLRRLRRAHDLTQEALAELAACSLDTLRAIETGRRRPSRELAALLAERLAVPPSERQAFLDRARGVEPSSPQPTVASEPVAPVALPQEAAAPLIGRAVELAALTTRLSDPSCRLTTIVGPGGVGKTSLAAILAVQLAHSFPDGVISVALAGAQSPGEAVSTIAGALGERPEGRQIGVAQLVATLRPRRLLLLLDNVEQLLDGPELVELCSAILAEAPGVRLLVTARERLRLRDEWVYELGGLAIDAETVISEAALLFLERARQVQSDFALTAANAAAIDQICRLVAGVPLALELAATWLPTLTPAEIAAELARSPELLTSDMRDLPARHRSMRAVFESSWRLLNAEQQVTLARLALFRGGFTRESAEFVAGARLPQLAALIQKSLLRRQGERYQIHELIRQFATEELSRIEAPEVAGQRYRDYFRAWVSEQMVLFQAADRSDSLARIDQELDNLRQALRLGLRLSPAEDSARLCVNLRDYWRMRMLYREGLSWYAQFLAIDGLSAQTRGLLLSGAANSLRQLGELARALPYAEEALALQRATGDQEGLGSALSTLSLILAEQGDFAAARAYQEECVAVQQRLGHHQRAALAMVNLGHIAASAQAWAETEAHYHAVIDLAQQHSQRSPAAAARCRLALLATLRGDLSGAQPCAAALPVLLDYQEHRELLLCLDVAAAQLGLRGQHEPAGWLVGVTERQRTERGFTHGGPILYPARDALLALARGPLDHAAWEQAQAAGDRLDLAAAVTVALEQLQ